MKLYTGPLSLFSAKVRIALEEKGLDADPVSVGWSLENRYRPHHPDVMALNPKAQVPVLVDGDTVVTDSTLILEYLEERQPEPPLMPSGLAERARCRGLEAWADEILFPAVWDLIEEVFYSAGGAGRTHAGEGRDADGEAGAGSSARASGARAALAGHYAWLDRELAGRDFLCGGFSVADIAVFVMMQAAITLGAAPDPGLASLRGWLDRTLARPAVRRDVDAMQAFAARCLAEARTGGDDERRNAP